MEILYLIPARGGSKGLSGKNAKELNGKPMIEYAIDSAKKSSYPGRIIVSTEDEGLAEISRKSGAEVIKRPEKLAQDESRTIDVVVHCLEKLRENDYTPDAVVLLQPTSPLRVSSDIDGAVGKFIESGADSCITVRESGHPVQWAMVLNGGDFLSPFLGWEMMNRQRQETKKTYYPNGAVFVTDVKKLLEKRTFYIKDSTVAYVMPPERSVDVDSMMDFMFAEFLLKEAEK